MSPEARRLLEKDWPEMAPRLRALLLRKGMNPARVDDIVQETALRLVQMDEAVDRTRSPWPLIVTIALNLQRDEFRSASRCEIQYELPDAPAVHDVESSGIARAELSSVMRAMRHLTQAQRAVLLEEIDGGTVGPSSAADKMLRMRARRKLRTMVERLSAGVAWRFRRVVDVFGQALSVDGAIAKVGTCLACAFVGLAATISLPLVPALTRPAIAAPSAGAGSVTVYRGAHVGHVGVRPTRVVVRRVDAHVASHNTSKAKQAQAPAASTLPSTPSLPVDQPSVPNAPVPNVPVPSSPQPDVPSVPDIPVPFLPLPSAPDAGHLTPR